MLNKSLFSSATNEWATPQKFFNELDKEFNFTLDPCATSENHKCKKYFTIKENGLIQSWENEVVFCNPPYGREIKKWVKKCYEEHIKHKITIVLLIPARTDTSYFHDYIYKKSELRFIRGRLKFNDGAGGLRFHQWLLFINKYRFETLKKENKCHYEIKNLFRVIGRNRAS